MDCANEVGTFFFQDFLFVSMSCVQNYGGMVGRRDWVVNGFWMLFGMGV